MRILRWNDGQSRGYLEEISFLNENRVLAACTAPKRDLLAPANARMLHRAPADLPSLLRDDQYVTPRTCRNLTKPVDDPTTARRFFPIDCKIIQAMRISKSPLTLRNH